MLFLLFTLKKNGNKILLLFLSLCYRTPPCLFLFLTFIFKIRKKITDFFESPSQKAALTFSSIPPRKRGRAMQLTSFHMILVNNRINLNLSSILINAKRQPKAMKLMLITWLFISSYFMRTFPDILLEINEIPGYNRNAAILE